MLITLKMLGKILIDLIPEAENAYEALDIYSTHLYKKIMMKEQANIDYKDDLEIYITLQAYRNDIANMVFNECKEGKRICC